MPWTAGAFLVGAMAIAGLPPLNGFASEWLTLQALLHVPAYGQSATASPERSRLQRSPRRPRSPLFCFVKVVGLVLLGAPRSAAAAPQEAPLPMRARSCSLPAGCVALGLVPGAALRPLVGLAPWSAGMPTHRRPRASRDGLASAGGIALVLAGSPASPRSCAGAACGGARADLGVRPARRAARSTGRAPASRSRCGSCSRPSCARSGRSWSGEGGLVQEVTYERHVRTCRGAPLRPVTALAMWGAHHARRTQSGRLGTYVGYLIALVLVVLAAAKLG